MAYPTIDRPYGLEPVNLIGGQVFAGSTRMVPITSGYNTSIFNGDLVQLATGTTAASGVAGSAIVTSTTVPSTSQAAQAAVPGTVGVFLGCEYSPPSGPIFGKIRQQYWPAGTVAQDAVAYVLDDPDAIFKAAVLTQTGATNANTGTTIGFMSQAFVGTNAYFVTGNGGSTATGNSLAGVTGNTPGASNGTGNVRKDNSTTAPFRIVQLVPDTASTVTTALTAGASSTSLTVGSTTGVFPGMQVIIPAATAGGAQGLYTYVTAVTSSTAVTVSASVTAASGSPVAFVGYSEVLVKMNFGYHSYYNATQIA
jgi:hypothetical protein